MEATITMDIVDQEIQREQDLLPRKVIILIKLSSKPISKIIPNFMQKKESASVDWQQQVEVKAALWHKTIP